MAIKMKKVLPLILIIVGLILIFPSSFFIYQIQSPNSNYDILVPISGSMEPTFYAGDLVKIETKITAEEIYAAPKDANPPGDIIAFYRYSDKIIHRASEKILNADGTYSFKTWGDNNGWPDGRLVKESEIIGKLVEINPPFWEYNLVLWYIILAGGILTLILGIVVLILTR